MQHSHEPVHAHQQRPEAHAYLSGAAASRTYTVRVPVQVTVDVDGAVTRVDIDREHLVDMVPRTSEVTDGNGNRTEPDVATREADQGVIDAYLAAHVQTVYPAEH